MALDSTYSFTETSKSTRSDVYLNFHTYFDLYLQQIKLKYDQWYRSSNFPLVTDAYAI